MRFRTRPGPRVEVIVVRLRSELLYEVVCSLSEASESSEGDGHEIKVELLVLDDLHWVSARSNGCHSVTTTTGAVV